MVVAFSCKGRGFCPSCGGRRMSELAAQLVDRVIPHVPVRQWVLSLPWSLRYHLAFDAGLCRDVLAVFMRVVFGWLSATAARHDIREAQCGAVTVIQRFGSSLNLNLHIHSLVLDGMYTRPTPDAAPVFHPPPPTDEEIGKVLERVHEGVQKLLRRRGRWPEEPSPRRSRGRADAALGRLCRRPHRPARSPSGLTPPPARESAAPTHMPDAPRSSRSRPPAP